MCACGEAGGESLQQHWDSVVLSGHVQTTFKQCSNSLTEFGTMSLTQKVFIVIFEHPFKMNTMFSTGFIDKIKNAASCCVLTSSRSEIKYLVELREDNDAFLQFNLELFM